MQPADLSACFAQARLRDGQWVKGVAGDAHQITSAAALASASRSPTPEPATTDAGASSALAGATSRIVIGDRRCPSCGLNPGASNAGISHSGKSAREPAAERRGTRGAASGDSWARERRFARLLTSLVDAVSRGDATGWEFAAAGGTSHQWASPCCRAALLDALGPIAAAASAAAAANSANTESWELEKTPSPAERASLCLQESAEQVPQPDKQTPAAASVLIMTREQAAPSADGAASTPPTAQSRDEGGREPPSLLATTEARNAAAAAHVLLSGAWGSARDVGPWTHRGTPRRSDDAGGLLRCESSFGSAGPEEEEIHGPDQSTGGASSSARSAPPDADAQLAGADDVAAGLSDDDTDSLLGAGASVEPTPRDLGRAGHFHGRVDAAVRPRRTCKRGAHSGSNTVSVLV